MNVSRDHGDPVCEGCLSQNPQTITEITEYDIKKVFYEIINILDANLSTISLHLCEECKDNIVKFLQFRRRVLDARDTINKYLSQSEANVVKTEQCTGTQSEIKSDPEEVVTTLPFVKVEVDADNHFLDDDSLDAEDLKPPLEKSSRKKNKVRSKKRTEDEFNDSDEEPLRKKKTETSVKKEKEKKKGRRERPAGVVDNSRVRRKLQQLNVDPALVAMEVLSWEQVAAERVSAASSPRYEQSVWRCESCVLGFNHRAKLDNHMKKHDPGVHGDANHIAFLVKKKNMLGIERKTLS
ncbi:unnamed protein product [Spodoptera exigua]|nr:unnamed protein product [Spodoptera exigua]